MEADGQVLLRKARETEAMRCRVAEMEEVKRLMEHQVQDYTIYEVRHNLPSLQSQQTYAE